MTVWMLLAGLALGALLFGGWAALGEVATWAANAALAFVAIALLVFGALWAANSWPDWALWAVVATGACFGLLVVYAAWRARTERDVGTGTVEVLVKPHGDGWRVSWQAQGREHAWHFDTETEARERARTIEGWDR